MVNTCFDTGFDRIKPERAISRRQAAAELLGEHASKPPRGWIYALCGGVFCLGLLIMTAAFQDDRFAASAAILATDGSQPGAAEFPLVSTVPEAVLLRVVESQGLDDDPEFVSQQWHWLAGIARVLDWRSISKDHDSHSAQAVRSLERAAGFKTDAKQARLYIDVTLRDGGKAARIADALAQAIVAAQKERAAEKATQERRDAAKAVADFGARLQTVKQRLADVQTGPAAVGSGDQTASIGSRANANAATWIEEAKADIDRIAHALLAGWTASLSELHFPMPELDRLASQYADLQRQLEKRKLTLGDKHPELLALEGQLRGLQKDIRGQWQKAADIANHNYRSAQSRVLASAHNEWAPDNDAEAADVGLEKLRSDVDLARSDYEHALRLQAKADTSADRQPSWSITPAAVPVSATYAPHSFILAGVLMLGGMLGAARTWATKRRGSSRQSTPSKDLSPQAFPIPRIRRDWLGETLKWKPRLDVACREVLDRPRSDFSQAIERLLELTTDAAEPGTRKVLIVSKEDKLGATTIAVNLAQTAAKAGHRVLLIEANRRHPILASLISPNVRLNLIDLNGTKRIICQLRERLTMIPLFDEQTAVDLQARTHHCLKGINRHFDFVILDGGTFTPDDEMMEMIGAVNRVFKLTSEGVEWKAGARTFVSAF